MADNRANLLYGESASLSALLSNIVNSRNIINVGIITKVIDENFINVRLYNTDIGSNPTYISAVRLLHIGTSKLKIKITPAIGDAVLLLASRDFIEVLENNHDKKAADVLVEPYSKSTMQAILISPEEDDNNKTLLTIDEEGNVSISTDGSISVSSEKDVSVSAKGDVTAECDGDLNVKAKGNVTAECDGDLDVESKGNATVKSNNTKLTGGIVEIGGSVTPSGQGALCGLPYCTYSGAPQTGKQTLGA